MIDPSVTHALPKSLIKDLTTLLPNGWILVYSVPIKTEDDKIEEGIAIYAGVKLESKLADIASFISNNLNNK